MYTVRPAEDAREMFACDFYREFAPVDKDLLVSPAAIMKVLFVLSQGAHEWLADEMLWDLCIKHVDSDAVFELALLDPTGLEAIQELIDEMNQPIDERALIEFLRDDFRELGDKVTIKNYFLAKSKFSFRADFHAFAKLYFNFQLLRKEKVESKKHLIDLRFSDCLTDADLDIFGLVEFNFHCKAPIEMNADGSLGAYGEFKYGVLAVGTGLNFCAEVVEIPLESRRNVNLSMLVFFPYDLVNFTKRVLGNDYNDFNYISSKMLPRVIDVKLPNMSMQKKYNLADYFSKEAENGLRDCFTAPVNMRRMFQNADEIFVEIGKYFQHTSLTVTAAKTPKSAPDDANQETDVPFDMRDKSFFFVIKSDKVLYVMGQFCKEEKEPTKAEQISASKSSLQNLRKADLNPVNQDLIRGNARGDVLQRRGSLRASIRDSLREDALNLPEQLKNLKEKQREAFRKDAAGRGAEDSLAKDRKTPLKDEDVGSLDDSLKFPSQLKNKQDRLAKEKQETQKDQEDKSDEKADEADEAEKGSLDDSLKFPSQLKKKEERLSKDKEGTKDEKEAKSEQKEERESKTAEEAKEPVERKSDGKLAESLSKAKKDETAIKENEGDKQADQQAKKDKTVKEPTKENEKEADTMKAQAKSAENLAESKKDTEEEEDDEAEENESEEKSSKKSEENLKNKKEKSENKKEDKKAAKTKGAGKTKKSKKEEDEEDSDDDDDDDEEDEKAK